MSDAICYEEAGRFFVKCEKTGKSYSWVLYETGTAAAHRVATIGCSMGWQRVVAEISRRRAAA